MKRFSKGDDCINSDTLFRILDVQDRALTDNEYNDLYKEYQSRSKAFMALFNSLPEEQQGTILDFLDASLSLHRRLMELAVELSSAPPSALG